MREKGFQPLRALGPDDPIEDIRYEVFRATRDATKKRNVKLMQKGLVTLTAGIEQLTRHWNPLHLKLDGYSKSTLLTIRDWDDIFEELHWKWADSVSMPVEMKLILTLLSSIWFFHMSNSSSSRPTTFASMPSVPPMPSPPAPFVVPTEAFVPPPPPPPTQSRMSGPGKVRISQTEGPAVVDITNLMGGLGMVQTLLGGGGGGGIFGSGGF